MNVNIGSLAFKIGILLLIITCLIPLAGARDYTLDGATTNITIDPSGLVHVKESISYAFVGQYNEVFRTLKMSPGESIQNIVGYCSDKACNFSINSTSEGYDLIASIPNPTPEKMTFFISYDLCGVVKVHKDISEFQYKLWGEEWDKPLGSLEGSIVIPVENKTEIQYWTHPIGYTQETNIEHNIISLKTMEIPAKQWYEIRVIFPRITSPNSSLVQIDNEEGFEKIKSIENEYETGSYFLKNLFYLTIAFAFLALVLPFIIYLIYGREPRINYHAIYEKEPPTNSKPAVVNAIVQGKMGIPTINGFTATILDLANIGYISFRNIKSEGDILIEISENGFYEEAKKDKRELEDFEKDALDLLKNHASENKVSWHNLRRELGNGTEFFYFINSWNKKVKTYTSIDKFFVSTGDRYVDTFGNVILFICTIILLIISIYFPTDQYPLVPELYHLIFFIIAYTIVMLIVSSKFYKVEGHWTPEGKLYYERWNNFKKYLIDLSALKQCSPESIKTWDYYLVYATALEVTKDFIENMSIVAPSKELKGSNLYLLNQNFAIFGTGFHSAYTSSAPSGSGVGGVGGGGGGISGIGGGLGGGGGGAI